MTNEELLQVVAAVIQSLKTNGKTIAQLTAVQTLQDSDFFEISGGRKVSYGVLYQLVSDAIETNMQGLTSDIAKTVIQRVAFDVTESTATLRIKQVGYAEVTQSMPVASNTQSGIITAADKVKLDNTYTKNEVNEKLEGVRPWPIDSFIKVGSPIKRETVCNSIVRNVKVTITDSAKAALIDTSTIGLWLLRHNYSASGSSLIENVARFTAKLKADGSRVQLNNTSVLGHADDVETHYSFVSADYGLMIDCDCDWETYVDYFGEYYGGTLATAVLAVNGNTYTTEPCYTLAQTHIVQGISADVEGLQSDIESLQSDVESLQDDVDGMRAQLVVEQETPASSTDVTGYLYSGGYYYDGGVGSKYHCLAIPCSAGQKYRIYNANGFNGAQVSLLWMVFNDTENLHDNRSVVIATSTGTTTGAHGTFDVTIPTNGVMLYVAYYYDSGNAYTPTVKLLTEEYADLQDLMDDITAAAESASAARSAATNAYVAATNAASAATNAASAAASAQQDVDGLKNALATEVLEPENATDVTGYLYINHYFYAGGSYHCKVVNVSEGEKYRIDNTNGFDGSTRSALYMVFNDANNVGQTSAKIMESSQTTGAQGTYDITIPSGGVVLYVAYYPGYEVTVRKITTSYTIVASKAFIGTFDRTVVLGDSISTLVSGNSLKWSDYVGEQLGVTIHNYAIGGANIAGMQNTNLADGSTNRNLIYQINQLPVNMASVAIAEGEESDGVYTYKVDNLIISMGFNDANNNRTIGDYDTVVAADWTTLEPATVTTDFASIMAAVKWAIFRLKSSPLMEEVNGDGIIIDCTKARIIWQTPIQCSSNGNWASIGGYAALNNKIVAVEEAIVQICNHYGVPVVIGRTASGISTEVELLTQEWNGTAVVNGTGKYLRDGIHPNDDGMKLLGQMNLAGLLGAH